MNKKKILAASAAVVACTLISVPQFISKKDQYSFFRKNQSGLNHVLSLVRKIQVGATAFATPSTDLAAYHSIRRGVGFVMGYRSHEDYVAYACNGTDPGEGND